MSNWQQTRHQTNVHINNIKWIHRHVNICICVYVCFSIVIKEEKVINSRGSGDTEGVRGDNGRVKCYKYSTHMKFSKL